MVKKPTSPKVDTKIPREQSSIGFPYGDLGDAIGIANGIMKCGGLPCDPDQLAAAVNMSPTSGGFRLKIATARMFGTINTVQGKYVLTDIGFGLTDKNLEKEARAEAFLKVPLYRRLYDDFRNRQLPPRPAPMERAFVGYGVAQKQAFRARQAFDRSAQQAGFFDQGGRDRLVRPITGQNISSSEPELSSSRDDMGPEGAAVDVFTVKRGGFGGGSGRGGGGGYAPLHPFVQGLLDTLPEPDTNWKVEGRAKWLQAAANIFDLMYRGGDGSVTVTAKDNRRGASDDNPADHGNHEAKGGEGE